MVSYDVPFLNDLPDEIRLFFDKVSYAEKSSGSVVFFERLEDRLRIPVFVAAVECQVQLFFGGGFCKICVIGFQLFDSCICGRKLTCLLYTSRCV